jgi:ankyrin repeat protein
MAFIYQAFQENILSKQSLILDFFFHGRGTPLQKTPVGMFRSLLHQLYTKVPLVRPPVLAAFKEKRGFGEVGIGWQWQRKELEDLFSMAVIHAAKYRTITIFVDALDEAGSDTANELAVYFHDLNVKFADRKCSARICISCRHYPILAANTSLDVCLEDENHDDIVQYVKHRFETGIPRQEMATLSAGECQLLEEIIVKKASGVFQWARLVVSVIISLSQQGESLSYINQELGKVPPDLGDVYEHILKMVIEPRNWAKTLHLMQWVCLAERPLSVTELRFAMASDDIYIHQSRQFCKDAKDFVDTDSRMEILITSWSGGLLEVKHQETQTTVQFIHQSVNDFLLSDGLKYLTSLSNNRLPQDDGESTTVSTEIFLGQSHNRLCKSCVNCLRLEEVILSSSAALRGNEVKSHFREKLPFIFYATNSWFLHAEKAERFGNLQQDLVQQFGFSLGPAFQAWLKNFHALDYWNEKRPELDSTLLHIASSSDLRSVAQILLLNSSTNVHTEDNAGNRALHYAACWGHTELVKILLDAGADIGAKNKNGNMALDRAAANGHQDALQLLLCQGADVDTQGRDFGTALQEASFGGHDAIVGLLLEKGADVNAQDGDFGTALQAASFGGHDAIVGWLIAKGADVNAQGGFFGTALQEASFRGYDAIVGLLLEKGADVNAQGRHFGTALQAASFRGHDAIVGRLIEKGADVNAQGGFFGTALQEASFKWYDGIVERLLEKGASQSQ